MQNFVKITLIVATISLLCALQSVDADCPSSTKVLNCTPKCLHDSECSSIGGRCCPNLCNGRSCVQPNVLSDSGKNTSPFSKNQGGSGTYCGNEKCSSFQKCEMDRSTKRPKCVRT